ncbi:hypothetical protein LPJ73_006379, partial [Coemansia sp. RSA 2703]
SAPPVSQMADVANTAIGYGAGRKESLQGSLNGLHIGMTGGSPGSPDMRVGSRAMSMAAYSSPLTAADFPTMSGPERDEFMQSIVADLSGDDSKAAERAIDRLGELFKSVPRPSDEQKRNPQMYLDSVGPVHQYIRGSLKDLVPAIAMQIRWAYTTTSTDPSLQSPLQATVGRLRENTLGVLIEVFTNAYFAMYVPMEALQTVIEELILRSVDPVLKSSDAGRKEEELLRVINTILVKIIDNADRTSIYVALIRLLDILMSEPAPNPPQTAYDIQRMNSGDMVQKCLWRLTKTLPRELQRQFTVHVHANAPLLIPESVGWPEFGDVARHPAIRPALILRAAHKFFSNVSEREWRKREDTRVYMFGDLPRRTVKTIHHDLTAFLRQRAWQYCGLIIRDVMESNPVYIPAPPVVTSAADMRDPVVVAWVEEANRRLARVSDMWRYVGSVGSGDAEAPPVELMMAAVRDAQKDTGDSGMSDADSDVDMERAAVQHQHQQYQQQQQPMGRASWAGSVASASASASPVQRARQVGGFGERGQSPQAYTMTAAAVPPRSVSMRAGEQAAA